MMLYKEYGKTGKKLSVVGFGGMRFGSPDDKDACVAMMVEAAKGGINYFDTAPAYFGTRSEERFGNGFRELKRLRLPFYCATKTAKSDEKSIRQEIEQQLALMQTELAQVRSEKAMWERRVALLRSDRIDPDMLDERARALIGLADPRDVTFLLPPR